MEKKESINLEELDKVSGGEHSKLLRPQICPICKKHFQAGALRIHMDTEHGIGE